MPDQNIPVTFRFAEASDYRYFADLVLNEPEMVKKNLGLLGFDDEYFKCSDWRVVIIAMNGKERIGCVSVSGGNSNGFNYIGFMYVVPKWRRCGVGKQLIKFASEYAFTTWNAGGIDLYTIENEGMDRLLYKNGFVPDGEETKHYYLNGKFIGQKRWIKIYEHIPQT